MLNRVVLIGRLVYEPSLKYTPAGVAVTEFKIAVDRPYKTAGEKKETDFIMIIAWRQLAETVAEYLKKGRLVSVEGRLQLRNYDHKDGYKVNVTEIIADHVGFLDSKGESAPEADDDLLA